MLFTGGQGMKLRWTWDPEKNRTNLQKHRISFETAKLVFDDQHFIPQDDPYPWEQRWKTIGMIGTTTVVVIHTWPGPSEPGRIISARKASPGERRAHEEGQYYA